MPEVSALPRRTSETIAVLDEFLDVEGLCAAKRKEARRGAAADRLNFLVWLSARDVLRADSLPAICRNL